LVADTLIESEDDAVRALEAAAQDDEAFREIAELAEAAGSNGLVALDLVSAISVQRAGP
jgi:hypothetical protein